MRNYKELLKDMWRMSIENLRTMGCVALLMFSFSHLLVFPASAQTDRQYVRQGNKLFRAGDYPKAEVSYRKALEKNDRNTQAIYNLGNALMAQKKDSASVVELEKAAKAETNPLRKSMAYHNLGVICQSKQLFAEAIENYKQSLRLNPDDDETRYNLELCKRQQKNQQQNQQKQDQNKKDDKKDQEQQKQEQQKQQQKQEQQPKMSKDNAEQLLNAAMQQEKQTQDRMKKAMQKPQRRNVEKNW